MNKIEIGARIKELRKGKMTQQELADKIRKTESSIRKYEKGLVLAPLDVLEEIAKALGTTPIDIIGAEYWDTKIDVEPLAEEVSSLTNFENYLKSLGYSITTEYDQILDSYQEDNGSLVVTDFTLIHSLMKDGNTATFSDEEYAAFRHDIEKSIEYQIWKKQNQ